MKDSSKWYGTIIIGLAVSGIILSYVQTQWIRKDIQKRCK